MTCEGTHKKFAIINKENQNETVIPLTTESKSKKSSTSRDIVIFPKENEPSKYSATQSMSKEASSKTQDTRSYKIKTPG